jgi:hypothetical protein
MFPSNEALVNALVATLAVALASILVFHPIVRNHVSPGQGVLAPTWALVISQSHSGSVFADGVKSITGASVGVGLGIACYALAELLPIDESARHVAATVLALPCAFLICLGDPVLGSPLTAWIKPDVASLSLYIVASFSKLNGYNAGLYAIVAFSFGSVSAILVSCTLRVITDMGSTQRRLKNSVYAFRAAQTHWLEGLAAFMTSASGDHANELDLRQDAAVRALGEFQGALSLAKVSDPFQVLKFPDNARELSVTAVLMHSQLLAFRDTITPNSYREDTTKATLIPILEQFDKTRMAVVLALRPTTPVRVCQDAHGGLKQFTNDLYSALIRNASATATNRSLDLPQGDEVVRLHFVVVSLIRLTLLVDRFLDQLEASTSLHSWWKSLSVFYTDKARNLFSRECWKKTSNWAHAFRSVLSQQIIAQIALFVARQSPNQFGPVIIWAQLPVVFCFLSTVGGSLIKGTRRVLGTLVGGAIGCVSAVVHAGSESSFFLEMIIIAFIGKLMSYHPNVGYAGPVFAFTWFICMLGSVTIGDSDSLLHAVFYRMVLTVSGVVASSLFAAILFPSFSSTQLRACMSKTVTTGAQLVVDGIRRVILGEPFDEDPSSPGPCAGTTVESFKGAGDKALKSIQKYVVVLPTLCQESRAELKCTCASSRHPSTKTLIRSEEILYRFIDAVLVLAATAAATRISRASHALFFTDQVVLALEHFADKAELAGTRLAAAIHGEESYNLDECYTGDRLDDVDRNLMAVRRILGQARKLPAAVEGGSPLIYVFHFALCELSDRWDDLVRTLDGSPETMGAKPERFRRINSSHSSLNII